MARGGEEGTTSTKGRQREPGQREATGPWTRRTPAAVREMERRQTLQHATEDELEDWAPEAIFYFLYYFNYLKFII